MDPLKVLKKSLHSNITFVNICENWQRWCSYIGTFLSFQWIQWSEMTVLYLYLVVWGVTDWDFSISGSSWSHSVVLCHFPCFSAKLSPLYKNGSPIIIDYRGGPKRYGRSKVRLLLHYPLWEFSRSSGRKSGYTLVGLRIPYNVIFELHCIVIMKEKTCPNHFCWQELGAPGEDLTAQGSARVVARMLSSSWLYSDIAVTDIMVILYNWWNWWWWVS